MEKSTDLSPLYTKLDLVNDSTFSKRENELPHKFYQYVVCQKPESGSYFNKTCSNLKRVMARPTFKTQTVSFLFFTVCCFISLLMIHLMMSLLTSDFFVKLDLSTGSNISVSYNTNWIKNLLYENLISSNKSVVNIGNGSGILSNQCQTIPESGRFDCIPQGTISHTKCILRGCCWAISQDNTNHSPRCFYPAKFRSYQLINETASKEGSVAYLQMTKSSVYPKNIPVIKIGFNYWTKDILQVKIYDPVNVRYEPLFPKLPPMIPVEAKRTKYSVHMDHYGFQILRKSNNKTIFNTQDIGALIFSDQLLQLSAGLPSNQLYGLGQQRNSFLLDTDWNRITLFNHCTPPKNGSNLYGSHPFYLAMEEGGLSDGVLLLNSNAMDIVLQPTPAITYRTVGGIFNFFFFLGPSPADVLRQYTSLIGRPFLPPYWSLGFHLCRFGYKTLDETKKVWNRTRVAGIPFDTQWNDLDYMKDANDFTYDKERFQDLPEFVSNLHKEGMHYVVLVDPGLSAGELPGVYPPYDQGMAQKVFINDISGYQPFIGKVWNKKSTVWVDFLNPGSVSYWIDQLRSMYNMFAFDGAWIDMNEPSNFLNGTVIGCPNTTLDNPPYLPLVDGQSMYYRTLCMSAKHYKGLAHYDVHNIYGLAEALVTSFAMQQIRNKRSFVISRSSFPGHGRYAGVWTGDISSTWDDMAHSVSDVLSFSLFGIPMSGADVCGFNSNTTVDLCTRWSQLGAFYPFSRNHNSYLSSDQDPVALGPQVVEAARSALLVRYSLLPYLYTLFWLAHRHGDTVARPMFLEFPFDNETYPIHSQFMWGPAFLITPVLKEGVTDVQVYFPLNQWYNFYSGQRIQGNNSWREFPAPIDTIHLFVRGGFIVPTHRPELTTVRSRSNPVDLLVALDDKGKASGDLYWDDGDSLDHNDGIYNVLKFYAENQKLHSEAQQWKYDREKLVLGKVTILGVNCSVNEVSVNGKVVSFVFNASYEVLNVNDLYIDMKKVIELKWK